jgi:hypothetical protein
LAYKISEAKTRYDLIDPALLRAGWDVNDPEQVRIEIPVDDFDAAAWSKLKTQLAAIRKAGNIADVELPKGISAYALYRPNCPRAHGADPLATRLIALDCRTR